MRSVSFELLEVQSFEGVEIALVWRCPDYLHHFAEAFDRGAIEAGIKLDVDLQPVEILIRKFHFHVALMKERQVTKDNVFKIAEKVGLDVNKLKADMNDANFDATIKETADLAQALGIEGTPGFIVDAKVNVGFVPADGLKQMISEARKSGCVVC